MADEPDYYELLGVSRTASAEEIQLAYRSLSKSTHPDGGGNAGLFRLIKQAHDTLVDPERRHRYDTRDDPAGSNDGAGVRTQSGASESRSASSRSEVFGGRLDRKVHCVQCGVTHKARVSEAGLIGGRDLGLHQVESIWCRWCSTAVTTQTSTASGAHFCPNCGSMIYFVRGNR